MPDASRSPLAEMASYRLPEGNVAIAFSGGRTSAFMLHEILRVNGPLPERVVVSFQNTGREMPQTLDFVQECGERWNVPIVWLEYRPDAPRFEVVSHNSASRDGEPFEALIRSRKFLPNQRFRFCTTEMKIRPMRDYLDSLGWERWATARGLRADEPSRVLKPQPPERWTYWHPLHEAGVTKRDVARFWSRQPFDLRLPNVRGKTQLGNCDGCFLKSEAAIAALARDYPERHAWWARMEALAAGLTSGSGGTFSKRYSRAEIGDMIDRQGDWIFDTEGALCQADGGECVGE